MASQQQRAINLRKSSEETKYIITQFHRPINFLDEFTGPVYFRKRTYVDEAEEINYGPDTETARIKTARARNEAKKQRRQQREEEYQNYLKSQEDEKKQKSPSDESEEVEEGEDQDKKTENATASTTTQTTNGSTKPDNKKRFKKKKTTRVRGKRNAAYVIEDENQTKGFEGTVLTPESEYAILLLQGGEFKLIFTDPQWVTFKPKQIFNHAGAEDEITQNDLDLELAAAERAMKEGAKREKDVAKFLVKDEDQLQHLLEESKFKTPKAKKREEADYRYVADDDEEVQVKSELTASDIMEEDTNEEEDDDMDKKLAKGMDAASDEEEDAGAEQVRKLLKEFRDPDLLMKKAEEAAQKKAEEEKLAKEAKEKEKLKKKDETKTPIKEEESTTKKLALAPPAKKSKTEEKIPPASSSAAAPTPTTMSLDNEVALLKTELVAFLQKNGGRASLKSVREQFIPKSTYPTGNAQKARLGVLIQVIKAVGVKEEINKEAFVVLKS